MNSPFNEASYHTLLEGLEVSIINKKEIYLDNEEFRIDSEYYQKEYLDLYTKIKGSPILDNLVYMSDLSTNGSFATVANIIHDNNPKIIPYIRSGNVGDTFINQSDLEFISKEAHEKLPKSTTKLHDIMMARKGKIGGASIIMNDEVDFNCNENVIKLTIKNMKEINPFYFTAYFNSKYGLKQIERLSTGNVQPWVSIFQLRKLMIPVLDSVLQTEIELIINKSHQAIIDSRIIYTKAEALLLKTVGLQDFTVPQEVSNIKSFKESFLSTRRLDAEYYQLKYEKIENIIKSNSYYTITEIFTILSNSSPSIYTEQGIKVIKTKNIRIPTVEIDKITDHTNEEKNLIQKNDLLFASMGVGSLGRLSFIDKEIDNCTTDGTIRVFRTKEIFKNKNFEIPTLLFLTSNYGKELIYKYVIGSTGIISISKENVENLIVPKVPKEIALKLTEMVLESQLLKSQSEQFLQVAKRAVEIAIEEGEEKAIHYINHQNIQ